MKRELVEEAALQIDVLKPLYLSENLFVESGEYRHEVILYFLAAMHARLDDAARRPAKPRVAPALVHARGRSCRRTSPRR